MVERHSIQETLIEVTSPQFIQTLADDEMSVLRDKRDLANWVENLMSYARRLLQARIDLREEEVDRLDGDEVAEAVSKILVEHRSATAPSARWTEVELDQEDQLNAEKWLAQAIAVVDDGSDEGSLERLSAAERGISDQRGKLHAVLEAISSEVVRRYQKGEADVNELLETKKA